MFGDYRELTCVNGARVTPPGNRDRIGSPRFSLNLFRRIPGVAAP